MENKHEQTEQERLEMEQLEDTMVKFQGFNSYEEYLEDTGQIDHDGDDPYLEGNLRMEAATNTYLSDLQKIGEMKGVELTIGFDECRIYLAEELDVDIPFDENHEEYLNALEKFNAMSAQEFKQELDYIKHLDNNGLKNDNENRDAFIQSNKTKFDEEVRFDNYRKFVRSIYDEMEEASEYHNDPEDNEYLEGYMNRVLNDQFIQQDNYILDLKELCAKKGVPVDNDFDKILGSYAFKKFEHDDYYLPGNNKVKQSLKEFDSMTPDKLKDEIGYITYVYMKPLGFMELVFDKDYDLSREGYEKSKTTVVSNIKRRFGM